MLLKVKQRAGAKQKQRLCRAGGRSGCENRFRKRRRERRGLLPSQAPWHNTVFRYTNNVAGSVVVFHVVCIDLGSRLQSIDSMPTENACDALAASVYCAVCKVNLNGREQYLDHLKGRMHRRRGGQFSGPSTAAPSEAGGDMPSTAAPSEAGGDMRRR